MTDAPERIWAAPDDDEDGWRWPVASKYIMQGYTTDVQVLYTRADLAAPTHAALLAAALKLPEVAAMRAQLLTAIQWADRFQWAAPWADDARTALAALEAKP